MADEAKKTRKTTAKSTTKKATAKAPAKAKTSAASAPRKPATPRKTDKYIRNLRGLTVHARLLSKNPKDPFRIALSPRGQYGDSTMVPAELTSDVTFVKGVGTLWEIITQTEFESAEYSGVGYLQREDAPQIIRPEDTTISEQDDWSGERGTVPPPRRTERGRQASEREFGTGLHTADVPGADHALHAMLKAAAEEGNEALPEGVDIASRRVTVTRARG